MDCQMQGEHTSFMHDIALCSSGKRMASCSTDRKIIIWDLGYSSGKQKYTRSGIIDGRSMHSASVTNLSWASSAYGSILASSGLDNRIKIWQEVNTKDGATWDILSDMPITGGVTAIKFAPRQFGLKIGASSGDGTVQTLVASGTNFKDWSQVGIFELTKKADGGSGHKVGVTALDWNPSNLEEKEMIVCGTEAGEVSVWIMDGSGMREKWSQIPLRQGDGSIIPIIHSKGSAITSVSWAPSIGRKYQLIASCSKDGHLLITKMYPITETANSQVEFRVVTVLSLPGAHSRNSIWRVSWNLTGTTLASSGDDGNVRLWKQSLCEVDPTTKEPIWKEVQCLQPQPVEELVGSTY
eukprot:TRINITY_DN6052_c0_g1_i2.p1 TRINITY_DN6052_c0_g1~~TRINITY_DN6052_c0_g1_i2.p1  ORF type:complete len:353 (+),score=47.10 TRINITY_DN6052_c0_g1_i2:75-1133(+)